MTAEVLFHVGIAVCIVAAVCSAAAVVAALFIWKRLRRRLDEEYGKRRH